MELFPTIKKLRVHEQIADHIRQLIADGKLRPGDRLPSERQLAEAFKVSRNSVRDALLTLQLLGLVERRHGEGVYVSRVTAEALVAPLAAILATKRELGAEVMDARMVLEPPIARLAAERAGPEDIYELEKVLRDQEARALEKDNGGWPDNEFHYAVAASTKNEVLMLVINHIIDLLAETCSVWHTDRVLASLRGHREILEAIKRHDPPGAEKAMIEHLREIDLMLREDR